LIWGDENRPALRNRAERGGAAKKNLGGKRKYVKEMLGSGTKRWFLQFKRGSPGGRWG